MITNRLPTCKLWAVGSKPAYNVLHSFSKKAAISWPCSLGKKFDIIPCLSDKLKRFFEEKCLLSVRNVCSFILKTIFLASQKLSILVSVCIFLSNEGVGENLCDESNLQQKSIFVDYQFCLFINVRNLYHNIILTNNNNQKLSYHISLLVL